jgi:hypothetical protein
MGYFIIIAYIYRGMDLWNELGGSNLLQPAATEFQSLTYFLINLVRNRYNQFIN